MITKCFIENIQNIQNNLLEFIEKEDDLEENYQNLYIYQFLEDIYSVKLFLHLIVKISNNHQRNPNFFNKIEKILLSLSSQIKIFQNTEIFDIFKSNRRLLLFLFENEILQIDDYVFNKIIENNYHIYFSLELRENLNEFPLNLADEIFDEIKAERDKEFEDKRRNGENDNQLCEIIRRDAKDEFIQYVKENKIKINSRINSSIYETNNFLLDKNPTLIEYSAFYGSISIFKYLHSKNVSINCDIYLYGIHSNMIEMIKLLEEYKIQAKNVYHRKILKESIKCHHINISNYFENLYLNIITEKYPIKYHNYLHIKKEITTPTAIYYLCKYDYINLVANLLIEMNFDLNMLIISSICIFNPISCSYHLSNFIIHNFITFTIEMFDKIPLYNILM